jgi:hypothetical protein
MDSASRAKTFVQDEVSEPVHSTSYGYIAQYSKFLAVRSSPRLPGGVVL